MTDQQDIIETALKRWKYAADCEESYRKLAIQDIKFAVGEQWDTWMTQTRAQTSRPSLTVNLINQFVQQICNTLVNNLPQIKIVATHDDMVEVAEIKNGIIRHIQDKSNMSISIGNAIQNMVINGLGFFRINADYIDNKSFDKELRFEIIENPLNVYVDPAASLPTFDDARYMFVVQDIPTEVFKERYPDKIPAVTSSLQSKGSAQLVWATQNDKAVRIADYFTIEETNHRTIYLLEDGETIVTKKIKGIKILEERQIFDKKIMWRKISALEVLEEQEWPGKYIPIVPLFGKTMWIDGKRDCQGIVRSLIDSQKMFNMMVSTEMEGINLAPKAPFIAAEGQIEGYEQFWENSNTVPYSILQYKPTSVNGTLVGPPQRQTFETPIQAISIARDQAANSMKSICGIQNANLGEHSNEVSGKAINARKVQGDIATSNYATSLGIAMQRAGIILEDLLPYYYNKEKVQRIMGADGTATYETINQRVVDEYGIDRILNDITIGEYDVTVVIGPSYQTKRQEDAANISNILESNPQLWAIAGDLLVKSLDWPDADLLAERLKKTLPPQLQPENEQDPNQEIPPQIKQYIDQLTQQNQQLLQIKEGMEEKIEELAWEQKARLLDLATKEKIAALESETKLTIQKLVLAGAGAKSTLDAELTHTHNLQAHATELQKMVIQNQIDQEFQEKQMEQQQAMMSNDAQNIEQEQQAA